MMSVPLAMFLYAIFINSVLYAFLRRMDVKVATSRDTLIALAATSPLALYLLAGETPTLLAVSLLGPMSVAVLFGARWFKMSRNS